MHRPGRVRPAGRGPQPGERGARRDAARRPGRAPPGRPPPGRAPKCSATAAPALSGSSTPPSTTTSRSPCTAQSASSPTSPGGAAYVVDERSRARPRAPSGTRPSTTATAPRDSQPSALARERTVSSASARSTRVDDQRLEPGVPGAAHLGGPGVDLRGGERDLAGVADDRLADASGASASPTDVGDVLLDHLDGQPDHLDGLVEAHNAGQRPRGDAEHLGGDRGAGRRGSRYQSTNAAMPACTISPIQDRSSADICRNHGMSRSMRARAAVVRPPDRPLQPPGDLRAAASCSRAPLARRGPGCHAPSLTAAGATVRRRRPPA